MPVTFRDVKLALTDRFDRKEDKNIIVRGIITDAQGNQSGAGEIWANFNTRRVWYMEHGAAQPAQIRCVKIPNPYIGQKILVGYAEGAMEREVLSDDPFDRVTNPNGGNWTTLQTDDMQPGGRALLWLQPKALIPLAVWPGSGLAININPGDYSLNDNQISYAGIAAFSMSAFQPAGPDEHLLVGFYLDDSGVLSTVTGSAVATSVTAPEPSWPDGIFQVATVLIDDTQTSFDFANDITNKKILYTTPYQLPLTTKGDILGFSTEPTRVPVSGNNDYVATEDSTNANGWAWKPPAGGGDRAWPAPDEIIVGTTAYGTIADAVTAAKSSGEPVYLGPGTYGTSTGGELNIEGITFIGAGQEVTFITQAGITGTSLFVVSDTVNAYFYNMTISGEFDTSSGIVGTIHTNTGTNIYAQNCDIIATKGGSWGGTACNAIYRQTNTYLWLDNCNVDGEDYAIYDNNTGWSINLWGGTYTDLYSGGGATGWIMRNPVITGSFSPSLGNFNLSGRWFDSNYALQLPGSAPSDGYVPTWVAANSRAEYKAPASGALELIAETTLTGSDTATEINVDLSSAQGYRHLMVMCNARTDRASTTDSILWQANADTGANYDQNYIAVVNATVSGGNSLGASNGFLGVCEAANSESGAFSPTQAWFFHYSSAVVDKWSESHTTSYGTPAAATVRSYFYTSRWDASSVAAITALKFFPANGPNFVAGTHLQVYGVK
jgi:hypothetical protein